MDDSLHPHHLQHPVPVVWFGELVLLLGAPRVCPRAPAHDVEDDDSLYGRQLDLLAVHLQLDLLVEVLGRRWLNDSRTGEGGTDLAHPPTNAFSQTDFHVHSYKKEF